MQVCGLSALLAVPFVFLSVTVIHISLAAGYVSC